MTSGARRMRWCPQPWVSSRRAPGQAAQLREAMDAAFDSGVARTVEVTAPGLEGGPPRRLEIRFVPLDPREAVAVVRDGRVLFTHVGVARMTMRPLNRAAIDAYLASAGAAVLESVGCYQLEGLGVHLFERIEGDYFTILGLPLLPLLGFLRAEGVIDLKGS